MLYSFGVVPGGGFVPYAGLTSVGGKVYGTTTVGGEYDGGVVFEVAPAPVAPSGPEPIVHSLGSFGDGATPYAGVIDVNGTLYGTTANGGTNLLGTVFAISPSGTETVLHSFGANGDGALPYANLTDVDGTLYGTTVQGGALNEGTVFAITPSGTETVLHSFTGGSADGANPYAGLTQLNGTLYGTTTQGGAHDDGTVFSITTSGAEGVVYAFAGGSNDGEDPYASLIAVNGTLYGTTYVGGIENDGTVFTVTPSGGERVIHDFYLSPYGSSLVDGANPYGGLVDVQGVLYGTTVFGGVQGHGTVFAIEPSTAEIVLHDFGTFSDGSEPMSSLIDVDGRLYGTTQGGGANGNGTIFAITP
ncbi:MAG TPA: choice-of-anchor tandem repeat GloVer-containing protein [Candidatus Cybelea sp.]|nr:choice-of-anchor tandem repeat GloVer-containing protein [Candidatus Cybelea sp.]